VERRLLRSRAFVRAAKKIVKRDARTAEAIRAALELLARDAFDPALKTHKLQGEFDGSWACSVAYDLRIVFQFVQREGVEAILLETIGTHEEVY
jgi:addiction module RelE/StbE family toxin